MPRFIIVPPFAALCPAYDQGLSSTQLLFIKKHHPLFNNKQEVSLQIKYQLW
jgi:hypothetical protein